MHRYICSGSFARGDFDEQSDIDIRIEKGNLKGMFCLMRFLYGSVGCIRTKSRCTDYRKSVR
ncbi:nucleotidyltransferase domain-containing protein [Waltera sp.]|uniref:nucleotidyltransferase domain-containing protein n=1 Tax=Waltera sp. TaxID=2815806 RepID=UPI0039A0EFCC